MQGNNLLKQYLLALNTRLLPLDCKMQNKLFEETQLSVTTHSLQNNVQNSEEHKKRLTSWEKISNDM
jgi:hypothetical protein